MDTTPIQEEDLDVASLQDDALIEPDDDDLALLESEMEEEESAEAKESEDNDDASEDPEKSELPSNADLIKQYFSEIGEIPLLTPEEEQRLARSYRAGDASTFDMLVRANLRLVVNIAKKYMNHGLDLPDLIQEGNIGLMKGIQKFDPNKGYKLSTYATWWIRQNVIRAIADQGRMIRVPVHMSESMYKVTTAAKDLMYQLSRQPSPEEIVDHLNETTPSKNNGRPVWTLDKVREVMQMTDTPVSLSTPVGEEGDSQLEDFIPSEGKTPESEADNTALHDALFAILDKFPEREKDVILKRFGFYDGRIYTLEEIGMQYNVTRERVRQIEAKVLRKMRSPSNSSKLKDFNTGS